MAQQSGSGTSTGLSENVASALCYILPPITSLVFFLVEPYSTNRTIRFHAIQSMLLVLAAIVIRIAFGIVWGVFYAIAPSLWPLFSALSSLLSLAFLVLFVYLAVRAYQGTSVDVPVVADYAHKYV